MENDNIDITKLDKAEVLAALYNASRQLGAGFHHARGALPMTVEQAREAIILGDDLHRQYPDIVSSPKQGRIYFDYLHGQVMKVDIGGTALSTWGYDRDNGEGSAARALKPLLIAARSKEEHLAMN